MSKTTWISAVLAALLGVGVVLWRDDPGRETSDTSPEPVAVTVAGHALSIPRNALRFPAQRVAGPQARLDLAVVPPDWSGRTAADAARFDAPAETSSVVWVTLAPAEGELDSAARLATVYARFFTGDPLPAPPELGLTGRRLSPAAGYVGEEVWFEPGVVRPFVARCWPLVPDGPVAACLSEEAVGGLMVSRRFARARLGDWRELRGGLAARLAEWGVTGR